tara:strand:+ start:4905 stop:6002 length:1098 start_codon:yes stop_codon:yes gene_type:complete
MDQNYEDYWKLTLEYTDFNNSSFKQTLETTVHKIDELNLNGNYNYKPSDYQQLQNEILVKVPKTSTIDNQLASTRKAINQCVKLGFINTKLRSYHNLTKEFLKAKTNRKRDILFSKIVYDNSSFNRSVTRDSNLHQLNFLINTLVENGKLSKAEIIALMLVDIENIPKGYLNNEELKSYLDAAQQSGFVERKYNQIGYLNNILGKLDEIIFVNDELYFTDDAKRIFGEDLKQESKKRNPYLHMLFKKSLYSESFELYGNEKVCFFEKRLYPYVIASHIKPFVESDDNEAYDTDNGFLLSPTIDSLFDGRIGKRPYLSFNDDGTIIFSKSIDKSVKDFWKDYKLDAKILNKKRKKYLKYHRGLLTK